MEVYCKFQHMNFSFEKNRNQAGYTCRVSNIIFTEGSSNRVQIFGEHSEGKFYKDLILIIVAIDYMKTQPIKFHDYASITLNIILFNLYN
jgi:hypothetical protein